MMKDTKMLLLANKAWAGQLVEERPDYFERQVAGQSPNFLWIGCSDSRIAPDQITNTPPGGMSIHRNVANLVYDDDMNLMAVLQTAVEKTKVQHVVLCGHYGCGGVQSGVDGTATGAIGRWVENVAQVYRDHAPELEALPTEKRANRIVELNVRDQLLRLARTSIIQDAFRRDQPLQLHGWVYDLRDGIIKPLMEIDATTALDALPHPEPVLV